MLKLHTVRSPTDRSVCLRQYVCACMYIQSRTQKEHIKWSRAQFSCLVQLLSSTYFVNLDASHAWPYLMVTDIQDGFHLSLIHIIAQAKMICSRAVFTFKLVLLCRAASSSRVACRILPTALWASFLHILLGHHGLNTTDTFPGLYVSSRSWQGSLNKT